MVSAAWSAVAAAVLGPWWPVGRAIDRAGARFLYGEARSGKAGDAIVLVEIDDAAVSELGPWPWDAGTVRKIFEAPFGSCRKVVCAVGAGDFARAEESGAVFWKGLRALDAVTAVTPSYGTLPPVEIAEVLNERPAGGQGEMSRRYIASYGDIGTRLPEWRALSMRAIASRYRRGNPGATAEDFVGRVLEPYWLTDVEVRGLARFWFAQAGAVEAVLARPGVEGFDAEAFGRVGEIDYICAPEETEGAVGVVGPSREAAVPYEHAFFLFREKPLLRLGFAAAGAIKGFKGARFEGRKIVLTKPRGKAWEVELDENGRFLPVWTGNRVAAWDADFRRFSAAALVETANARRAVWEGYHIYEKGLGENRLRALADEYEGALDAMDLAKLERANSRIFARVRELKEILAETDAEDTGDGERLGAAQEKKDKTLENLLSLEFDYQTLRDSLAEAFAERIVVIAPTAAQFGRMETPRGQEVPAAALEVAIINSVVEGRKITQAPEWVWWAAVMGGGFVMAFASGRLGGIRGAVAALLATAAALFAWYALFAVREEFLGLSAVTVMPLGYAVGAIFWRMTIGEQRSRVRRMVAGRLSAGTSRRVVRGFGKEILRTVRRGAVLETALEGEGGQGLGDEIHQRYVNTIKEAIFAFDGAVLDESGGIEGAFGWLSEGGDAETAVSAGLSMRNKLKFVMEKLAAEGAGAVALRMGVGSGKGRLSPGRAARDSLVASGEAFERAREAVRQARRWKAGMVASADEFEALSADHELRRLDPEGRFYEVLERKGALSVTMRRVRDDYERALGLIEKGESDEARGILAEAIGQIGDGPSSVLLGLVTAGDSGRGAEGRS